MGNFLDQFAYIDKEDRTDPLKALRDLCNNDDLFSWRKDMLLMLESAMSGSAWEGDESEEKSGRIWTYEQLIQFIELAYLISRHTALDQINYTPKFVPYYD